MQVITTASGRFFLRRGYNSTREVMGTSVNAN